MIVQYKKTEEITSEAVTLNIKIIMNKAEAQKITADELRELAHSKLDHAIGDDDG